VARRIYRRIGHHILIKKNMENYKNSGKIYVNNISKIFQTILSLYDLARLSLTKSKDHFRDKEHSIINEEINLDERI
jgi:phytoene synthase